MLKAGALIYAIVVSLLVAIVVATLIGMAYMHNFVNESWLLAERVRLNAVSGLSLLLGNDPAWEDDRIVLDLYGEQRDTVILEKRPWGAFEIITSTAIAKGNRFTQSAMVGTGSSEPSFALYLADRDAALAVCGKTSLKGRCFLPAAGTRKTYIEGKNFQGDVPPSSLLLHSGREIPPPPPRLVQAMLAYLSFQAGEHDSLYNVEESTLPDTILHDFRSATLYLRAAGKLKLAEKKYEGNVCICSQKEIVVSKSCTLNDVILCAPVIRVEKEFSGCLQAIASDSLLIGEKVVLAYPSAAVVVNDEPGKKSMLLELGEDAVFTGSLFAFDKRSDNQRQMRIQVSKNVHLTGELYSNGSVSLEGKVRGSVTCPKFFLQTPSSFYDNQLLDASIDREKLPEPFVGILSGGTGGPKKIIKWL